MVSVWVASTCFLISWWAVFAFQHWLGHRHVLVQGRASVVLVVLAVPAVSVVPVVLPDAAAGGACV